MLKINSDIEGKSAYYGEVWRPFEKNGFCLSNGWEYDHAMFDSILTQHEGVSIYLRLPVEVIEGKLDQPGARLRFGCPFVIKHVVHTGLIDDDEDSNIPSLSALNQFQKPLDPDDRIERDSKWRLAGEEAISKIKSYLQ